MSKNDWQLFRQKLPVWQERYMQEVVYDYIRILNGSENPSDKFWTLEKRIKNDKRHPGVSVEMTKENMLPTVTELCRVGVVYKSELEGFSEQFIEALSLML